jgi:membrane protein DedA with SNARE-associated domain
MPWLGFHRVNTTTADEIIEPHRRPAYGPFLLVAFVGLVVCTNIANIVFARWVNTRPEQLIMLSSRNRYLVLVVGAGISPFAYAVIATVRLTAAAAVCHFLGRAYGDQALRWFTRFLGMSPEAVDRFEQQYRIAEWVLIPIFVGSNIVFVLSGTVKTRWRRILPLLLAGIAGRLALLWWLTKQFESEVKSVTNFLQRYQYPIIIVSIVLVVVSNVVNFRRGRA